MLDVRNYRSTHTQERLASLLRAAVLSGWCEPLSIIETEDPMTNISPAVKAGASTMTGIRRDLHQHPELGFQEVRTAEIIARRLSQLGYTVRTGLGKTGVAAFLKGGKPGKTVLLRADIDALPISEETDVAWKSQTPGVMHA